METSSRGLLSGILATAFLLGGAGIYACSDSASPDGQASADSGSSGPDPIGNGEFPDGGMYDGDDGEGLPGGDGDGDGGINPTPPDMTAPNMQPEVQGTETPVSDKYWPLGVDLGVVDEDEEFRAVVILQLRNQTELMAKIDSIYTPGSAQFRKYLTVTEFMDRYAPSEATLNDVKSWLTSKGFKIERTAKNRLLIHYSGTVRQFNSAFGTKLHLIRRTSTTWRAPAYAPLTPLDVPQALIGKIKRLHLPDPAAEVGMLSKDVAPILTTPPDPDPEKLTPQQIAKAYGISDLYSMGYKGAGMTIGVIGATLFKDSDAQSMWQTFGISRKNPTVVQTMEPIITRDLETTLDIQLAGAIAPEAEIIYYGGPNNSDTTLLYTFNEAIADNRAQVLSDSFAHAEASTPYSISRSYNESALMAAAIGITVLAASGDSNQVDVPSNSPYVTAVGGTNVELNADNSWKAEQSWGLSGCGRSRLFAMPSWQSGEYSASRGLRTNADVSAVVGPYWVKYLNSSYYARHAYTPAYRRDQDGGRIRPGEHTGAGHRRSEPGRTTG
jgi:kumamolisin